MGELDLTAAIEAGADALDEVLDISTSAQTLADAAVRAAAPIIERAVREAHGRHFSFGCVKCQSGARDAGWVNPEAEHAANVVLTFVDQDGHEWLAAAVMTPLERFGQVCQVGDMPDRAFALKGFRVVTDGG
jgi:hypothetical protein